MQIFYYSLILKFYFKKDIFRIMFTFFLYSLLYFSFKNGILDFSLCEESSGASTETTITKKEEKYFFSKVLNPFNNYGDDDALKQDYSIIFLMVLVVSKILIKYSGG